MQNAKNRMETVLPHSPVMRQQANHWKPSRASMNAKCDLSLSNDCKSNKIRRNGNQWMKHTVDCKLDPNWYLRNGCTWGHVKFLPVSLEYRLSRKEIKYVARPDRHIYRLCFLSSRVLTTTARTAHTIKSNEKWGFPSSLDNRISHRYFKGVFHSNIR